MNPDLPITAIGLIAFICAGAATLIWRQQKAFLEAQSAQQKTFMEYIETKNGIVERIAKEHKETVTALINSRI